MIQRIDEYIKFKKTILFLLSINPDFQNQH